MSKVLVISASPRANANSDILADEVVAGATAAHAEVEKVRLKDLTINYCLACDACQKALEAGCVQKDDMAELCDKLLAADAIVFASPIYFFSASGQMKGFLDRTYALGGGGDWTAMSGKRAALVFTYGDSNPLHSGVANAFRMFQDAALFLRYEIVDCLPASCGPAGAIREKPEVLAAAKALGARLAQAGE